MGAEEKHIVLGAEKEHHVENNWLALGVVKEHLIPNASSRSFPPQRRRLRGENEDQNGII